MPKSDIANAIAVSLGAIPGALSRYYLTEWSSPETLAAGHNLATSYDDVGRKDQALKLREEVLTLMRKVNGPEHHNTLMAMNNLAASYSETGRKDEALKLRQELAGLSAGTHPAPASLPAPVGAAVGNSLKSMEEGLETVRKAKGPETPEAIAAMTALAAAYGADGSGRKAIKLGEEALALARRVLPAGDPHTVEAMKVLIRLYRLVDNDVAAAKLEEEIKVLPTKP